MNCLVAGSESTSVKPNLIFVLLDDVSAKEFTCYGGQGISTPNLDRMAHDGVMFRSAWSMPVCGPSRACLQTGRYGERTHYLDNDIMPRRPFWKTNRVLGQVLQSAGYATAMIGKSHFSNDPHADLGFDEYCILRYWPGYDGPPQAGNAKGTASMYAIQWYWHPGFLADGKGLPTKPDDFGPDIEVERIRGFIAGHKSQPFFVYYPFNLPHMTVSSTNAPMGPGAKWSYTDVPARDAQGNKTGQRVRGSLKTDLEYADYLIGRIWAQVVADGLERRTIIMIAGDNGTAGYGKARLNSEVALRVPFIVYGPGLVKGRGPCEALVDFSDIFPTLAELAGAKVAEDYVLDGRSFAPLLLGQPYAGRQWIHSFLGTARWLRDQRWLLDGLGKFYDCGTNRNETLGYRDVTTSSDAEVVAARARFEGILKTIPAADTNDPAIGPALMRFEERRSGAGKKGNLSRPGQRSSKTTEELKPRREIALRDFTRHRRLCNSFPLTPALSLGERENHSPRVRTPCASNVFERRPAMLPLPKGEGRGEGEQSHQFLTDGRNASGKPPMESPVPRLLIGAIRWDGWFKDNPWEKNLRDVKWRYRLPFFAEVSGAGDVRVCGDSQEVMDREIAYAKAGGLSYWAFCYYHPGPSGRMESYNYGWKRYLASERKRDLNFCLLLQGTHLGPTNEWEATVAQFIGLFKEPTYQRVCEGRPLVYIYSCDQLIPHFGSAKAAREALERLRAASEKAGAGEPYLVAQIWPDMTKASFLDAVRFDALGAYSAQGGTNGGAPFSKLLGMNRWYWNHYKETGRQVVPLVNAGWDGRPRNYPGAWYETAKPAEVAQSVKAAFNWTQANPGSAQTGTMLIYAWNEYDEGGWLCPTRNADGTANADRLEALASVIRPGRAAAR